MRIKATKGLVVRRLGTGGSTLSGVIPRAGDRGWRPGVDRTRGAKVVRTEADRLGWRPVTAAGWIVTAAFAVLAALLGAFLGGWGIAVALVAYSVVIALTGAKPGHSGF